MPLHFMLLELKIRYKATTPRSRHELVRLFVIVPNNGFRISPGYCAGCLACFENSWVSPPFEFLPTGQWVKTHGPIVMNIQCGDYNGQTSKFSSVGGVDRRDMSGGLGIWANLIGNPNTGLPGSSHIHRVNSRTSRVDYEPSMRFFLTVPAFSVVNTPANMHGDDLQRMSLRTISSKSKIHPVLFENRTTVLKGPFLRR
ncbi:hypothetical protein BGW80DRAFT_1249757 [Lactifluus volemus]|nr:hypothetical protein BGW80DRAFT_1249757 [Lactifluus volemus]